jgi:hypothetical protein
MLQVLSSSEITQRDKLIAILSSADETPLPVYSIKAIAIHSGLREIEKWNVSTILGNAKGLTVKSKDGWYLTVNGQAYADFEITKILKNPISTKSIAIELRPLLRSISNDESKAFVEEAIQCLEANAKKAAVVFSWVGAISVLYDYVISKKLNGFNVEAQRRDAKWKKATTRDDLTRMKESDFLDILAALSIIGPNVKEHLKNTELQMRNSCGHPNSIVVGKLNVEAHIEFLIQNVFSVF